MVKNIIANFIGIFWSLLSNFLFIPLYIKYLGFESYSIISFSLIGLGILSIIDTGLTSTLSREFARGDVEFEKKKNLFDALEKIYLIVILLLGALFLIITPSIAANFITSSKYTSSQIALFLRIFTFDILFSLLIKFYFGAYIGLQKQVKVNKLMIFWGAIRNGVVIIIIHFFPTLFTFYLWQALTTVLFFIGLRISLNKELYNTVGFINLRKKIDIKPLNKVFLFTSGVMLISLVSSINTLLDRVFISRMFEIKNLGYYTLAITLSSAIYFLTKPVSVALLPVFTNYITTKKEKKLKNLYNGVSFLLSALTFSIASNIFFFSYEILNLWTGNQELANNASLYLKVLILGYSISSLQHLSYDVAIANGSTRINNILGFCSLIFVLPSYWMSLTRFGPLGIAYAFTAIQIVSTIIYIYIINKEFLSNTRVFRDIITIYVLPFLISFILSSITKSSTNYFQISNRLVLCLICAVSVLFCFIFLVISFGKMGDLQKVFHLMPFLKKSAKE